MKKFINISLLILLTAFILNCKEEKKPAWIDMRAVQFDGSFNDKFLFRKEIEEQRNRSNKYKKSNFE